MVRPLHLSPSFAGSPGDIDLRSAISRIVRSSRWTLDRSEYALSVEGPGCEHYRADDDLPHALRHFAEGRAFHAPLAFAERGDRFDLCLEDNWTGLFVAEAICAWPDREPLIFVHLDDHTDMMSTLLERDGVSLINPLTGAPFDPAQPADWREAIEAGAITIGAFVTALYHLARAVHVRHLKHDLPQDDRCFQVCPDEERHALLPGRAFASIRQQEQDHPESLGTYRRGQDAGRLLRDLPSGRLIVHIDLDYFINDFNGNIGELPSESLASQREEAQRRMDAFFHALGRTGRPVDRWIVATSPGFCAVRHWDWLLGRLSEGLSEWSRSIEPQPS